ncbi:NUDIX hydrolase [Caballeronia choica]|uniref:NUDIX hydrolase n=2 Tax=Caballeronia choica TaxID=326476 RepID=A0A158II54_9BURK|nr:NUDIX hydrolase [Caballeronia choica]
MWLLPGGVVERDELVIVAAIREVYEETGMEAHAAAFMFEHVSAHHVHHVFRIAISDNEHPKACAEAASVKWVTPEQLINFRATPGTKAILERALSASPSVR